jgi:hypothetical protein
MDAHVFSSSIGYNGYIPQFPQPPKYIKVRSHDKKNPEFNRMFLAQELHGLSQASGLGKEGEANIAKTRPQLSHTGAIWAAQFSLDGRYLAAGGQQKIVWIWATIASPDDRQAHEKEEDASPATNDGEKEHLNAPVFQSKPIHQYSGHGSDILDLDWSKVRTFCQTNP